MGAILVRVAVATGTDINVVRRQPYARTLWTYRHLDQQDHVDGLREKSRAIYAASLVAFAVNDPKGLTDEHRRLMIEANLVASVDDTRESAQSLVAEIAQIDQANAWGTQ